MYLPSNVRQTYADEVCHNKSSPIDQGDFPTEDVHAQVCVNDRTETDGRFCCKKHGYHRIRKCPSDLAWRRAHEPKAHGITEPVQEVCMAEMACELGVKRRHDVCSGYAWYEYCQAQQQAYKRNIKRRIFSSLHCFDILRMMIPATLGSSPKHGAGCMITSSTARVSGISGCSRLNTLKSSYSA